MRWSSTAQPGGSGLIGSRGWNARLKGGLIVLGLGGCLVGVGALVAKPGMSGLVLVAACTALITSASARHPGPILWAVIVLSIEEAWLVEELPRVSGIQLRLTDPFLAGITIVVLGQLISRSRPSMAHKAWIAASLLALVLLLQAARGWPSWGINALGELRTYYGSLIALPYIAVVARSAKERRALFKYVLAAVVVLIVFTLFRAATDQPLTQGTGIDRFRWMTAQAALAVLFMLAGLVVAARYRVLSPGVITTSSALLLIGSLLLVVTSHRSVWMTAVAVFILLLLLKQLPLRHHLLIAAAIALVGGYFVSSTIRALGYSPTDLIETRLAAFTSPTQDDTANWRTEVWQAALEDFKQRPWVGRGFGPHFELRGPGGERITTSPHNLYLTLGVQTGVLGLGAYALVALWMGAAFLQTRKDPACEASDAALATLGFVVLVGVHFFYMVYSLEQDWISWSFVGLGFAVVTARNRSGLSRVGPRPRIRTRLVSPRPL